MKNKIIITISIIFSIVFSKCTLECIDNSEITEISKLELACKVWGYLKYYHPGAGSGEVDWDLELFKMLNELDSVNTKKDVNQIISNMLNDLSQFKTSDIGSHVSAKNVMKKINLSWLNDTLLLSNNNSFNLCLLKKILSSNSFIAERSFIFSCITCFALSISKNSDFISFVLLKMA